MGKIILTQNWWEEIGNLGFPDRLVQILREVVNGHMRKSKVISARATEEEISLAKEYLLNGIWIDTPERLGFYQLMVYIPQDTNTRHSVFQLVSCYPDGELRRLQEL